MAQFSVGVNKAYAFKEKRGDDEFEYDAIVPWGDYLFVFECKNRSLPFGDAVQMHYFDLATRKHIRQLHRLMKGLRDHPDMLEKHLPPDAKSKRPIPVLLNFSTYSAPGPMDEVYMYDWSALTRFFESGTIKLHSFQPGHQIKEQETEHRLWVGDKPTPDDFLAQLKRPLQVESVRQSLTLTRRDYFLPPDWRVMDMCFERRESETLLKILNDNRDS